MKEVYLLRHGEKDGAGVLTERGKRAAAAMRPALPSFACVISSGSDRTILTAKLLTGQDPQIDHRAAYATTPAKISDAINTLASTHKSSFLDAARQYGDPMVLKGIDEQAHLLNLLVDELLGRLVEGEKALIVSHDLTIAPAMGLRGMSAESIEPLGGYVIRMAGGVSSVGRLEYDDSRC